MWDMAVIFVASASRLLLPYDSTFSKVDMRFNMISTLIIFYVSL
ncbi:hypothetical protein [Herbinix luporum]|nr:hypothetical protein [Herbinix luporum]